MKNPGEITDEILTLVVMSWDKSFNLKEVHRLITSAILLDRAEILGELEIHSKAAEIAGASGGALSRAMSAGAVTIIEKLADKIYQSALDKDPEVPVE